MPQPANHSFRFVKTRADIRDATGIKGSVDWKIGLAGAADEDRSNLSLLQT